MMKTTSLRCMAFVCSMAVVAAAAAQDKKVTVTGSVQSDVLVPQQDTKIGTEPTNDMFLTNTYAELGVLRRHVDAGLRFEFTKHPLPGFDPEFAGTDDSGYPLLQQGWGVPHIYVKAHYDKWEATVGTFYEQFGSGFILRTYEDRAMGVDNSLLGGRVVVRPYKGITVKALSGTQRLYWELSKSVVSGADVELGVEEWIPALADKGTRLTVGGSYVNKYEKDEEVLADLTHRLNLPTSVNAFDVRAGVQQGNLNVLLEYAVKGQDPSVGTSNAMSYIYRKGSAAMLSASYSKKGLSILAQAKRSDNMAFRSRRTSRLTTGYINHLPAFAMDHTYALAALYSYATQTDGEWAYQGEVGYKFKKGTPLGGKYGTSIKANISHIRDIDRTWDGNGGKGSDGYSSRFFKQGATTFYQDINVTLDKRLSSTVSLTAMYMNQVYNKAVIEKEGDKIHSHIFVADAKWRINKKTTLRGELQYLTTRDDQGDWAFGLVELSLAPMLMFTVSDMWNSGDTHLHYYQGGITVNKGAHRLQMGYGRTRAGYNCSGGVCRWVPASKGFTASYNYNF